ncbi:uncharacterized protein LOC118492079 [Helianthus annuus]|uniref:uncharacterized protein LOC118492079 n=1 Tax=Helianthus annuus TaxID=4232 RepID=UPI0016531565|nr:uncharacterized protein LOC118492079 [Helianthus annuus]
MSNLLYNDHKSSSSGEVKRNLHEMYDVDDMVGCSSTKRRLGDEKEEAQNSESSNLLIPKIENIVVMSAKGDVLSSLFTNDSTFSNVGDVWEISKPKKVLILANVKNIINNSWYCMTCPTCSNEATLEVEEFFSPDCFDDVKQLEVYHCSNYDCSETTVKPVPKFKINLEVGDDSDSVELVLFHNQAAELINKSPKQLIQDNTTCDDIVVVPKEIRSLVGKFFAFKIEITEYNLVHYDEVYGITHISSDETLICDIKNKFLCGQDRKSINGKRGVNEVFDIHEIIDTGERRRVRKAIIDSKKAKRKSSNKKVGVTLRDKENLTQVSNVTNQFNTPIQFNRSINSTSSLLNITSANNNIHNNDGALSTPTLYSFNSSIVTATNPCTTSNTSSLSKLSVGKRKLKHMARDITPVVMVDLDSVDESNEEVFVLDPYKGISTDYLDHGDPDVICQICYAKLWSSEGGKGRITMDKLCYGLCCGYGKVELPVLKDANSEYQQLFHNCDTKSKFFLKNIRRYNSMFSFTSMGGKVDSKINKGIAPFIYRISGQNCHSLGSLRPPNGKQAKFSQLYIYDTENEISNRQSVLGMVRNHFHENPQANLKLRLIYKRDKDGRTYNLPSTNEIAALIVDDLDPSIDRRDILIETESGMLQRISELHPSYLALQYPILFPFGDDGYRIDIPHREGFLVDAYTMIESERLNFIRGKKKNLRSESFENLQKYKDNGKQNLSNTGQKVILPSSFTGGARFMQQNYLDAMALCKWFGYPDFFITITCNPKWPEVSRFLKDTSIKAEDRPDIICRLFKMKLDSMIKDIKDNKFFGEINAVVYTVEFQKRGLPHAHICLFMKVDHKLPTVDHIDPFISAEIPDKSEDPQLHYLVSEYMIHGPCGAANLSCPCMVDNKCSKRFPKKFSDHTIIDSSGFPVYRRRDSGHTVMKKGVQLDNRSIVPYNKGLLKRYQAHINVEWCNQAGSIKYIFKYINKGPDRATAVLYTDSTGTSNQKINDEIKQYYDCRYISACEASWRIFANEVHYRYPAVMRLPFHLPGQHNVVYGEDDDIEDVLNKPTVASSIFLQWMRLNERDEEARKLSYVEFPTKYVWNLKDRRWQVRKRYKTIGRVHSVSIASGEPYYLRILLNKVRGPKSFEEIRTVNGQVFPTFKDACYAMGLLDDDNEYVEAIKEASFEAHCRYLRSLFATLLLTNTLSRPEFVWEKTWHLLGDDILFKRRKETHTPDLIIPEHHLKNLILVEIENYLISNGSTLSKFSTMPFPDDDSLRQGTNRLINEELSHDTHELKRKTFLWKTLAAAIRSKGQIVLNVASSGIASLLLSRGRTAHSRFKIPINLTEDSMCFIKPNDDVANLLKESKLIIWDEAPMVHKHAFEALDRTMKDILSSSTNNSSELPFGGKVIVFGGDFRQILPVIPNGTRQQIVNSSLSSSYLWFECKVLKLTKNMRLRIGAESSNSDSIQKFAKWLLDIGEGNIGSENDGEAFIELPDDLVITDSDDPIQSLIDFVYPSILHQYKNPGFFSERAILAPKNEVVHEINDRLLSLFPGEEKEYLSCDSICQTEQVLDSFQQGLYSPDNLNALKISGLPNHRLVLKVGVPVMLLRNIDQQNGLCNGTRLQVTFLGKRVIEAEVISGGNIGTRVFIPRISMVPSDKKIPFQFQRRQFPLTVCFAMTINKSQGHSLSRVGLYLKDPVFTHGQLYVALSRVKSRQGVKILSFDCDGKPTAKTSNVVYKEIFHNL